jgi:type IV pilus assembly protein PilM
MLSRKKKNTSVVGLELDAGSVAAAEPAVDGAGTVSRVGVQALPSGAVREGEVVDPEPVVAALTALFDREGLTKKVRLGVANQNVAMRVLRLPVIEDPKQLTNAIRFLAQEQIPMPLDSALLDHQVIGGAVSEDGSRQIDVAVVAARRETVESLLATVRRAGLDPVGVDLTAFGMIRALAGDADRLEETGSEQESFVQATLFCSLGDLTNLAIARESACLFARVAEFGVRQISESLSTERGLYLEHADQWLLHTGLEAPLEALDGDPELLAAARRTLESGVLRLADELRLSIDSYAAQDGSVPVGSLVLCGWGGAIAGLADRLRQELGREVEVRRPAALAGLPANIAGRLTVPYGIGLEE